MNHWPYLPEREERAAWRAFVRKEWWRLLIDSSLHGARLRGLHLTVAQRVAGLVQPETLDRATKHGWGVAVTRDGGQFYASPNSFVPKGQVVILDLNHS